MNTRKQQ
jgi:hypothetical protein